MSYHAFYSGLALTIYLLFLCVGVIIYVKWNRYRIRRIKINKNDNIHHVIVTIKSMKQVQTLNTPNSESPYPKQGGWMFVPSLYYVLFYLVVFDIVISLLILLFPELLSAMNLTCSYRANKFINPVGIRMFGILLFTISVFIITGLISIYSKLRTMNTLQPNNLIEDITTYTYLHIIFQVTSTKNAVFFLYILITIIEHAISETFIEQTIPIAISLWIFFGVLLFHCLIIILSWFTSKQTLTLLRKNTLKPEYPNNNNQKGYVFFNKPQ